MGLSTTLYFLLFLALLWPLPRISLAREPTTISQVPLAVANTYSVVGFNGNQSFVIQLQPHDKSFTTPRGYYYMGVGGYGFSPASVQVANSTGSTIGNVRATGGIIWLPHMPPGNYTVTTSDRGSFLLALDVQNSGDRFVGNVSAPVALFMVPFQKGGVHVDVQVSRPTDGYWVDIYDESLTNFYSQRYAGNSNFDLTLPSQGASLVYARISPEQRTIVQFTWTSAPQGTNFLELLPIIFPLSLIAALVVFVIIRSRRTV